MNLFEQQYKVLVHEILSNGYLRQTRTGATQAVFNKQIRIGNVKQAFPLLTGRKISFNTVKAEYEWMYGGHTNAMWLWRFRVHIWDKWMKDDGDLGPIYGALIKEQWSKCMEDLRKNHQTRRAIIELWDPKRVDEMALPPCYHTFQFFIVDGVIHMTVQFRSSDVAVGLPHDVPVLALFLMQAARETGTSAGTLTCNLVDAHINSENFEAMNEYVSRDTFTELPKVELVEDELLLIGYQYNKLPFPRLIVKE